MSRRIIYKIEDRQDYLVTDEEWYEVRRLQHWYNSEFYWTTGKLAFKRYVLFPNAEEFAGLETSIWQLIEERRKKLKEQGLSEFEMIAQLERDQLVFVKWGGYFDGCLASGFTRVADNEWNAFLVCDFLLKVSTLLPHLTIEMRDEGRFIRTKRLWLRDGVALLPKRKNGFSETVGGLVKRKQFFATVDPARYDKHPAFKNSIPNFNELKDEDRKAVVKNWNWLGYGNGYRDQDSPEGADLNRKLRGFDFLE